MLQRISNEQLVSGRLDAVFKAQRAAFLSDTMPSKDERLARLDKLEQLVIENESAFIDSMSLDFGHRSKHESIMLDIVSTLGCIRHLKKYTPSWMKKRKVRTPLALQPASSHIMPQPLGVIGVITPWNFPVYLSLAGIATALAAGNRCMLKPSELTPRTSALMADLLEKAFGEDLVGVIQGDASVAAAFSAMPFDHLMFTGSTQVGKAVAGAAAENLTPCTLELGGKSPFIVAPSGDVAEAAKSVVHGKMLNAGQICVAPDYALVLRNKMPEFVEHIKTNLAAQYPSLLSNPDVSQIITPKHRARLQQLIDEAKQAGCEVIQVNPGNETLADDSEKLPLTLVIDPPENLMVMQQEIFGSILPIKPYDSLDEAIRYVQDHDRPLALYLFVNDDGEKETVMTRTHAGGCTVNDIGWHVLNDNMPFGGVGASGMGAYHGQTGFDSMSKLKPVLEQSKVNAIPLLRAPYGQAFESIVKVLRKII